MPLPSWPSGVPYAPLVDSFQPIVRALPPIATEFEAGNQRQRRRAGDNVGTLQQEILMDLAPFNTFTAWWTATLSLGTARFTAPVWLGSDYVTKVCQFTPDGKPRDSVFAPGTLRVAMKLRVYGI